MKRLLAFALLGTVLATPVLADPHDGNPKVTIRHCEAQVDAENRNDQTLGYLIRIGKFVGDGRIVEQGQLRPGESIRRIYRGELFVRIRLGLPSDHYYSSDEGSTHCTPTPSPSPSPSPSPTPSTSPTPTPSPSQTPPPPTVTPTPEPSESSPPPPSTTPSPSESGDATASSTAPPCTPPCTDGGTPNTGGGVVYYLGLAALTLFLCGSLILRHVYRGPR